MPTVPKHMPQMFNTKFEAILPRTEKKRSSVLSAVTTVAENVTTVIKRESPRKNKTKKYRVEKGTKFKILHQSQLPDIPSIEYKSKSDSQCSAKAG